MTLLNSRRLIAVVLLAAGGCVGTETENPGNPGQKTQSAILARSSDPANVSLGGGGRVEVTFLSIGFNQLTMNICTDEADLPLSRITFEAEEVVPIPDIPNAFFCSVQLEVEPAPPNASIAIDGFVTQADGQRVPFTLRSESILTVDFSLPADESLSSNGEDAWFFALDINMWLGGADIASGSIEDGVISISMASNTMLLQEVEGAFAGAFQHGKDLDGDGLFDPDSEGVTQGK